uniref:Uncharacterized protein n=1 Tax=Avena sativa TaxID=4498 RepID=A0ACD5VFW0_AVESA
MINHTVCKRTSSDHISGKPICKKARPKVKLEDLPQDLLCTIVSKLPPKQVSRASVLSSHWRYICDICCFKLCFSGTAGYTRDTFERKEYLQYMQKFIDNVNTVVQKCNGKMVEEFSVKFEFDEALLDHLNNWVNFAVSSRAKSIAVYLRPINKRRTDVDRYVFPFHLLDNESNMSHLQSLQLSFVSFRLPSDFRGFPSLRKLDLEFVHISIEDIEVLLSNCYNLGWLSLVRSYLNGELKLNHPLSNLRHLTFVYCMVTRIELQVMNLVTFVYYGPIVPIVINQHSKLESAYICFREANFHDAVNALVNGIPSIQNLTFQTTPPPLEGQSLLNNKCKFSHLRCLQLLMGILAEDTYKLPHVLVSVLRAAPFIEKLEIHFAAGSHLCFANNSTLGKKHLQPSEYSYLKSMHMTGYKGARGQLEFLLHIVENAPVLEELTVETTQRLYEDVYAKLICKKKACSERAALDAGSCLRGKLSPKVKLCVM